jgi:rod shape-determining protein MreC
MESFLNRYRNITVLLLVIFAQLVLLAVQVRNDQDVRMIRVWTVTAVTPLARVMEWMRGGSIGFVRDYILLHDTHEENRRLQSEVDRMKVENTFLKNELNMAERGKALALFQEHTPSKTVAANVIGSGAGTNSKVVFADRGSTAGVQRGMAVVTPDGIVGTVIESYPTASEILLITDADFAAGVVSQKTGVRGTLKGQGTPLCRVDYVPFEEKVDVGDWFYTSGDDRVFPRGFPVGVVKAVHPGQPFKEILVEPSGMHRGLEDVLILLEGVHQIIPSEQVAYQPVYIAPAPPGTEPGPAGPAAPGGTEADKLRAHYKALGDAQNHKFGEGLPGSKPPDFNLTLKLGQTVAQGPGAGGPGLANAPAKPALAPSVPTAPTAKPPSTTTVPANSSAPGPRPSASGSSPASNSAPGPRPGAANPDLPAPAPPAVPVSERPHNE